MGGAIRKGVGQAKQDISDIVEAWEYDPGRLAEGDLVDPLSLFLCLRDDPDERVQIALAQHMEALAW